MSSTILLSIDGVRPDALTKANCPNLLNFQARGASTLTASAVMPSVTLPCHMSIFHSVPPTRHGVVTNDWMPMARPLPGLIDQAHTHGLRCAAFYSWEPLRNLSLPGSLAFAYFRDSADIDLEADQPVAEAASHYLNSEALDFVFVYFGTIDIAGHKYGWLSEGYLAQLERVDRLFGDFVDALPPDTTLLVQSDHGGHDRSHGTDSAEDMTIPWLVAGPGIKAGYEITSDVSLLDTAPTLARLLSLKSHPDWEGRCLDEIFL